MIGTQNETSHREVVDAIRWAAPIVAEVDLIATDGGWEAHMTLDPALVRARAGQQGIRDRSVSAAAGDPRLQQALEHSVNTVNARLAADSQIVHHLIVL